MLLKASEEGLSVMDGSSSVETQAAMWSLAAFKTKSDSSYTPQQDTTVGLPQGTQPGKPLTCARICLSALSVVFNSGNCYAHGIWRRTEHGTRLHCVSVTAISFN